MDGHIPMHETSKLNDESTSRQGNVRPRVTRKAMSIVTFVAVSGLWNFGYSIGSVNALYLPVTRFIKGQYEIRYGHNVTSSFVNAVWVTSCSIYPVGALFGTLGLGPLVRRHGRLKSILIGHVFVIALSLLMGLSSVCGAPEMIIIGRFGLGIASGAVGTGVCTMYITEISPLHVRGIFGSLVGIGITFGIFSSNLLGLPQALGNDALWPVLLAFTGLPSVFFVMGYKFMPESPRKLYIEENKEDESIKVLRLMNGINDVDYILKEMAEEKLKSVSLTQMNIFQVLRSTKLRSSVLAAVCLGMGHQLTGINGVVSYMNTSFIQAGLSQSCAPFFSVAVIGVRLLVQFITMSMTEKYGRKPLLLISYSFEAVFLLLLTIYTELSYLSPVMPYLAVISSLGYNLAFSIGAGAVTFSVIAELFDQTSRSAGITIANASLWLSFTLCLAVTPYMQTAIRGYTFLPFFLIATCCIWFIAARVPETKKATFAEIVAYDTKNSKTIT